MDNNKESAAAQAAENKNSVQAILDTLIQQVNKKKKWIIADGVEPLQINSETFFTNCRNGGYVEAQEFINHIAALNENERIAFDGLLKLMSEGESLDSPNFEKVYRGRRAMYIVNEQPLGNREFTVYTTGNMITFVGLYQMGLLKCNITLESLCREAVRLTTLQSSIV